jgi:hypothetical protein
VPFAVGRREKLTVEDGFLGVLTTNGFKGRVGRGRELIVMKM